MCGISGIFNFGNYQKDQLKSDLKRFNKDLNHRGPDANGIWIDSTRRVGLAHTRLSILDLSSAGTQPMINKNTKDVICFNGEIFNYLDLNKKYFPNHNFQSKSDTETILKLYQKYHLNIFDKMDGMFAFAIWDHRRQELLLARDKSGKKPLYFAEINGQLVFASELKALINFRGYRKEISLEKVHDFFSYHYVPGFDTIFKNIHKLEPGSFMRIDKTGVFEKKKYYNFRKENIVFDNEEDLAKIIHSRISISIKNRMISDTPVGAFLSGGVDSSAIVAFMRKYSQNEIKTFSIDFEDQDSYNENEYAEKISKEFSTNHFVHTVKPNDLLDMLPKIIDIYDDPQADTTAIPIYFISKLSKMENIKVVLNGDGPDELFNGYSKDIKLLKFHKYYKILEKIPFFLKKTLFEVANRTTSNSVIIDYLNRLYLNREYYCPNLKGVKEHEATKIFSKTFINEINYHSSYQLVRGLKRDYHKFNSSSDDSDGLLDWIAYSGFITSDIERFLFRSDRIGMNNSIELRSPFLSNEMVRLGLSIPSSMKVKNNIPKYIFKKSLQDVLSHEILYRPKKGFCLPIKEWASSTICGYVEDNIKNFNKNFPLFNEDYILNQIKKLKTDRAADVNKVWSYYFFMNWYKKWAE